MDHPTDPRPTDVPGSAAEGHSSHQPTVLGGAQSVPADSLEAGLAAGFGTPAAPRSTLGDLRPVLLKEADGESSQVVKPQSDALPPKSETGDRYRLDGEIARGGMGAVLRGRDVDLGRDLAVKVLLEKYANRPEVARRFIEEAQIGGQLQHPGVVPIYDIGKFGDRPFFTMKLVKGETLATILHSRADAHADRPRLLGIVLQVAQTLAYAHAKGVIHRDLKPANIMVGAFGEVQVMDWGLAKVLAEGGIADEERASRPHEPRDEATVIRTARSAGSTGSHGTQTEAGSILGTPAYMPPEQASGDIAHLDRRADVFGLGAILCEVLTGKPPYLGRSGEEVRRKAANGDLADATARLDDCDADPELIALAKQCLSPEAIDRPKDAQQVADGLSAYLNGVQERLQTAERERAVAVARAEEEVKTRQVAEEKAVEQRKRRRVQAQLAASLAVLVLGGVSVAWWQTQQAGARRETELQRQLVDEQRAAADNARLARNAEAVAGLLSQAEEALQAGDAAKADVALQAATKRSAEGGAETESDRLTRLDQDLQLLRELDAVDQFRWTVIEGRFPDPAAVATRTRDALNGFGADPDAASSKIVTERILKSNVRVRIVSALDRLLRQTESAPVRALLRRVDADPYRDAVRDVALDGDSRKLENLSSQHEALQQTPGFLAILGESPAINVERRRQLLLTALGREPAHLGLIMTLGSTFQGDEKEWPEERLRWYQAAVAAAPTNYAAHLNLSMALIAKGELQEAIGSYRNTIAIDPRQAIGHNNLGIALAETGQVDEAIACFRKTIELDPQNASAHNHLGHGLKKKGHLKEAIDQYRQAIELAPSRGDFHVNLGHAFEVNGHVNDAIACYRSAIEINPQLAIAHNNLGNLLQAKGQVDEAIASWRKAIELDPQNSMAHSNLGAMLCDVKRDYAGAIACFRRAIELDPQFEVAYGNLGRALSADGRMDEAITCWRKAVELNPHSTTAVTNLANGLHLKGQLDEAIALYGHAIELAPNDAMTHNNLGSTLLLKGKVDEAIASYRKAIEIDQQFAMAHCNLGIGLSRQGRFVESLAALKRSRQLAATQSIGNYPSADLVREAEVLARLEAKLPGYLEHQSEPIDNPERLKLAFVCQSKKLMHTAARLYTEAFTADPKLADDLNANHRYNAACCAALAAAGEGIDSVCLDEQERIRLRQQALVWLKADLVLRSQTLQRTRPTDRAAALQVLRHWQQDPDLASLRDESALAKLPADEQQAIAELWTAVAALLKQAETPHANGEK